MNNLKQADIKNNKSFNIYLSKNHKYLIKKEADRRGLTISAFLRSAALEKIMREKNLHS